MMDTRIALKSDTELRGLNVDNGLRVYTIENELARGASCIVYNASYINNLKVKKRVHIKECYPFSLSIIRNEDGALVASKCDEDKFEEHKKKMKDAFNLGNELFDTSGLTNFTTNTIDIYEHNSTTYVVTTYMEGSTLTFDMFSNLKECITVVKSISKVIDKIHQKGYLHLDIKPENVYVLKDTNGIVQIFDFDSFIPIGVLGNNTKSCEYKIAYTRGFSALELKVANYKNIGRHTDVYSIGAVLFYLIFGEIPKALDCSYNAEYDYEESKYADIAFQDRLYYELTDFFHNTLANYYLDRYPNMQQVILKLEEIEKLADTNIPYFYNSYIPCPKIFVGREKEFNELDKWFKNKKNGVLFVSGMGGIGKSTLITAYLSQNMYEFNVVMYMDFYNSLKETIIDDNKFKINTVFKREEENVDEYFLRKIEIATKLVKEQNVVFVIDNFNTNNVEDLTCLKELLKMGLKIVVITRNHKFSEEYECLELEKIQDRKDIYYMFENYMRREIEQDEYPIIDRIIEKVNGHTLVLELIAKQILNSFLTIEEAENLIDEYGLLNMAVEKVTYTKDDIMFIDTIKNIINKLFLSDNVTEYKKLILKSISFFGNIKIDINLFCDIYGLKNKDIINELISEGWIMVDRQKINIHPIIMEVIGDWNNVESFEQKVTYMMEKICNHILSFKKIMLLNKENGKISDDNYFNKEKNVEHSNYIKLNDNCNNAKMMLAYGEEFEKNCKKYNTIIQKQEYKELLYAIVTSMDRYREQYILENSIILFNDYGNLRDDKVIKIFDMIVEIYEERRELDKAYEYIQLIKPFVNESNNNYIKSQYYYTVVGYYDYKLDGYYSAKDIDRKKYLIVLLKSLNKAIRYMRKSNHVDSKKELAEYIRCKANIYIRSFSRKKKKILSLLEEVEDIIKKEYQENTDLNSAYYLTYAWYYVYITPNHDKARECIINAYNIQLKIREKNLDLIDNFYIPAANICLEMGDFKESKRWLMLGVDICEENKTIIPFIRKKMELYTYLLDVYEIAEDMKEYSNLLDIIKEANLKYKELGLAIELEEDGI